MHIIILNKQECYGALLLNLIYPTKHNIYLIKHGWSKTLIVGKKQRFSPTTCVLLEFVQEKAGGR